MLIQISQQGRDARSHETGVVCGFGGKVADGMWITGAGFDCYGEGGLEFWGGEVDRCLSGFGWGGYIDVYV